VEIIDQVVGPVDLSSASAKALHHAAAWAHWYGVPLRVMHVAMPPQVLADGVSQIVVFPARPLADVRAEVEAFVATALRDEKRLEDEPRPVIEVLEGQDVREILAASERWPCALFVMGTHGASGLDRVLFGSVTHRVSQAIANPLLVVPPHAPSGPRAALEAQRIICAVDFRPSSLAALRYALSLAQQGPRQLQLVTVVDRPWADEIPTLDQDQEERTTMREALRDRVPASLRQMCVIEEDVLRGEPADALLRHAEAVNGDLIVLGAGDHGYLHKLWLGSTTAKVMRAAACPVLVVPAPCPPAFAEAKPVERREWNSELTRLSLAYRGQPATVSIVRDDLGTQREATALPFLGVTADLRQGGEEIAVMLARAGGAHLTHVVPHPREIRLREPDTEHDLELVIVSRDGSTTVLDVGRHTSL
jgi:nucleotide-binding universal stress UspA family protein